MTNCPSCGQLLKEERDAYGVLWRWPACGGRMVALAALTSIAIAFLGYAVFNKYKWEFAENL
jgi:hypothetical protein